ncbi:YebC/PmpR family DNA-binding transcriptional regulator [Desulfuribacillus alkaliarsenatis]|uniref:Probable transcriptional regulatory protein BHF68_12520 n=1 Tax=Desulfuribacillus alkaliarsenatis TaxID=766136 RepID=A0A1E5FYL8_9FIRM|nr:YebC/PmpR family DNA-binding transcriptional regulator [Desulfuribacillus alkaliarsenatis]OEF95660.1 transcriptional regulator [Desulfuribacillus alkaliarsenatis]
MAGHSKWKNIAHRKGKQDAARGKIFTRLSKEIMVAARQGGGDPTANARLRLAISKAREHNMPNDNIERVIKKATGELEGVNYEEISYEGYGPAGVAVYVEVVTDSRNRAASDMRHIFSKYGGNLGESGCVSWMFDKKGIININKADITIDEEELLLLALDAGADDLIGDEDAFEIVTEPDSFEQVKEQLVAADIQINSSEITMVPQNTISLTGDDAKKMLKLMEKLEENDDVQNVYANFDISDEDMQKYHS